MIYLNISTRARINKQKRRKVLLYNKADWANFNEELRNLNNLIHNDFSVQEMWDLFETTLLNLIYKYIPSKNVQPNNTPPWLSKDLLNMCKQKEKAYIKWKTSGLLDDELLYRELKTKTQREIRLSHSKFLEGIFNKVDPMDDYNQSRKKQPGKRFWSFIKNKRQDSQGVAPLCKDGVRALDSKT